MKQFLDVLPQGLEASVETVKRALDQTVREIELAEKHEAEARDASWATFTITVTPLSRTTSWLQSLVRFSRSKAQRDIS
jgi:hypothetical protein